MCNIDIDISGWVSVNMSYTTSVNVYTCDEAMLTTNGISLASITPEHPVTYKKVATTRLPEMKNIPSNFRCLLVKR